MQTSRRHEALGMNDYAYSSSPDQSNYSAVSLIPLGSIKTRLNFCRSLASSFRSSLRRMGGGLVHLLLFACD